MEFLMVTRSKRPQEWSVGIDLHKDTMTICLFCQATGEIVYKRLACKCREQIVEFFRSLPRPNVVAIEAVGFYRWLWELLEPIVQKLVLADATAARALAGRRLKTDREDAFNVADLLANGRLPVAYAPPAEVQALRDWSRRRNRLSRQHARVLHWVKSLMNLNNRPGAKRLDAAGLTRYLKAQGGKLPERHRRLLWDCVEQLTLIERQIDAIERELMPLLDQPRFRPAAEILATFPGVGLVTTATVLAEVGDFHRFTHRKAIARYAGLNPTVYASGGKQRLGHIAKAGPPDLRWVMQQAAWTAIRVEANLKRMWLKIGRSAGRKAAAVAVARKMLTWMWYAVREGKPYQRRAKAL
jgi:transposase